MRNFGTFNTPSKAYRAVLASVWNDPENLVMPRGIRTREVLNSTFEIPEATTISFTHTGSKKRDDVVREYTAKERRLYFSAETKATEWVDKGSKFWGQLANPDGTINSNYWQILARELSAPFIWERAKEMRDDGGGEGFGTQIAWVIQTLLRDVDSRQAFAHISMPRHQWLGNKDQPCTMHLHFSIRDMKLNMTSVMRSQDVIKGLTYDMPFFLEVKRYVLLALRRGGPPGGLSGVARPDGKTSLLPALDQGTYTSFVHSIHIYEKDRDVVNQILNKEE